MYSATKMKYESEYPRRGKSSGLCRCYMTRPNTKGIRKCGATVLAAPKKKHRNEEMNEERPRPCGKKAVATYRIKHNWGEDWVCVCPDHDPKSDDVQTFRKAIGTNLRQWDRYPSLRKVERQEELVPYVDVQRTRAIENLVRMMGLKNATKMDEKDWREIMEAAIVEHATRKVVEG
jgi:hypothetical protein